MYYFVKEVHQHGLYISGILFFNNYHNYFLLIYMHSAELDF